MAQFQGWPRSDSWVCLEKGPSSLPRTSWHWNLPWARVSAEPWSWHATGAAPSTGRVWGKTIPEMDKAQPTALVALAKISLGTAVPLFASVFHLQSTV